MHDTGFTIFSGISTILVLLPLPLHWRAQNASTILCILWLFVTNLMYFVNSIVWWDNVGNPAPIWCDISIRIIVGVQPALSGASLCINRRLALIASSRAVSIGQRQKRNALLFDLFFCLIFPFILMIVFYVVQPHRANIYEGVGCQFAVWPSVLSIFLFAWWPVLISLISSIYGGIAVRFFLTQRLQFQTLLKSSSSGLDTAQYVRLIGLATSVIVLGIPLSLYYLVQTCLTLLPWTGWDDIHYGWSYIGIYSADDVTTSQTAVVVLLSRWLLPLLAMVFFLLFGVADDALAEYARWTSKVAGWLRISSGQARYEDQPKFLPQLGTAVTKPSGGSWDDNISANETNFDARSPLTTSTGAPIDRKELAASGNGVVVEVERNVA